MKTLAKADREAQRAADAGTFKVDENAVRTFRIGHYEVRYFGNGGGGPDARATNFRVRSVSDHDEPQSDYHAGFFRDTLTGAIRSARGLDADWRAEQAWLAERAARPRLVPAAPQDSETLGSELDAQGGPSC